MIDLGKDIVSNLAASSSREWLETNGIGGYALGTVSGSHTRRYDGLLVAAATPPLGRVVLLSKFEEKLIIDETEFELSTNQYPEAIQPDGYKYLTEFRLDPFPVWTFEIGGVRFEKKVFMIHGENTTVCRWRVTSEPLQNIRLELRPLLAFRDHHHLRHEDTNFDTSYQINDNIVSFRPYQEFPSLYLSSNASSVESTGAWYRNFEYEIERERGFDFMEDLFQPCVLAFDLATPAFVTASTDPASIDVVAAEEDEVRRRAEIVVRTGVNDEELWPLLLAADQFIVKRGEGKTVIAGYPWFSDWGRDTMIALPGLTLATERPDVAKSILREFSKYISQGMIPNRFPDEGETPEYNTVDATLWFFEAIRAYADFTKDHNFIRDELYLKLVDIIEWHVLGTRFQIRLDSDGLLHAGEPGVQLTWMDAKVGDLVITPRTGKAVEIQALWYNALCVMNDLATRFGDAENQPRYFEMAEVARDSFVGQFWNAADHCLFDVVGEQSKDVSIRPNQIFAVSLHHPILSGDKARAVVDKVEAELLTPVGLRSLSPNDMSYVGRYLGSPFERDSSYHQGTVWGWLIGPFVDAYRRVHAADRNVEALVSNMLSTVLLHLSDTGLGQVSEIFDGDAPHAPRGCPAQAWSVAEPLRVIRKPL